MSEPEYRTECVFAPDLRANPAALRRNVRARRRDRWQLVGMFQAGSGLILMLFQRQRPGRVRRHVLTRAA